MKISAAVVLLGAALLAAAAATAAPRAEAEAKAQEVSSALRSLTQAQKEALRNAIVASAQEAVIGILTQLPQPANANTAEQERVLKAWAKAVEAAAAEGEEGAAVDLLTPRLDDDESLADAVRRILRDGWPAKGVPPLDPFRPPSVATEVDIPGVVRLQAILEDASVDGLATFQQHGHVDLNIRAIAPLVTATLDFDVLVPSLRLLGQYAVNGDAETGEHIWGDGLLEIVLNELRVQGNASLKLWVYAPPEINICEMNVNAKNVNVNIEGLFGDEELSQLVGEALTDVLNESFLDEIFNTVTDTTKEGACSYMRSLSTIDWIAIFETYLMYCTKPAP